MATQLEIVRLITPEFASLSDVTVQAFLDLAPLLFDPTKIPVEQRGLAIAYKACSLMLDQADSAAGLSHGGELTMEKEGDLSRSFSGGSVSSAKRKNIYEQRLDELFMGAIPCGIMTRYGISGEVR